MASFSVTASVALLLASCVAGDDTTVVWGSVIYNRMGERTPEVLGNLPTILTTVGSQQSYAAGQFFRSRYLTSQTDRLHGMNVNLLDSDQLYVLALDQQTSVASAQAFVQGLYPPVTINSSATTLDPTSITSAQDYIEAPLGGYQYAQIHVSGGLDADYIYLGGNILCPAFDQASDAGRYSAQYLKWRTASSSVYLAMGPFLRDILIPAAWEFDNAYAIYDYISYLAAHNSSVASLLEQPQYIDPATNQSYLYTLQYLADAQQQLQLGNMSSYNSVSKSTSLPETGGSISTIAGNMLAAKMLAHLQLNVQSAGEEFKLSVLFGDFEPIVSLFALMNVAHFNTNFIGLPQYASSVVFELYSKETSTNNTYPSLDNLWVAFHFRNGSANSTSFLEYPAFGRGPSQTEMSWNDFEALMTYISLGGVGDWCTQCGATNIFCAPWNSSLVYTTASTTQSSSSKSTLSPAAAGAVGAVIALAVAGLLFGLVLLLGRVRFYRRPKKDQNEMGGYKGSAKLASDRDLTLPKNGVVVGTTAEQNVVAAGHERTGSWELKDAENEHKATTTHDRPSFDEDELHVNPFSDPVKVHEQV